MGSPVTPVPTNPYNVNNGSINRVTTDPNAQAYFNAQSPEDQAAIRASWGGRPAPAPGGGPLRGLRQMLFDNYQGSYMNQWYNNAQNAGATPPPAPAAAPAPAPAAQPVAAQPYAGYNPAANVNQPAPSGPQHQPQPQPAGGGAAAVGGPAVGAVSNMLANNFGTPPVKPQRNVGEEYEAWKQGGRVGARPEGT